MTDQSNIWTEAPFACLSGGTCSDARQPRLDSPCNFPGNDYVVDLRMPLDREGKGHVPNALAGTTLQIGRFSGKPIVIEAWDGQPFELP